MADDKQAELEPSFEKLNSLISSNQHQKALKVIDTSEFSVWHLNTLSNQVIELAADGNHLRHLQF